MATTQDCWQPQGPVTIAAFATTVGLGANFGLFERDRARLPRRAARRPRRATVRGARHPRRRSPVTTTPPGRRRRRLILSARPRPVDVKPGGRVRTSTRSAVSSSSTRTRRPGDRVGERQPPGVEERAVERERRPAPAVGGVADHRVADRLRGARGSGGCGRSRAGTRAARRRGRGTRATTSYAVRALRPPSADRHARRAAHRAPDRRVDDAARPSRACPRRAPT